MGSFDIVPGIILAFVNYAEKVDCRAHLLDQWATEALNLLKENKAQQETQPRKKGLVRSPLLHNNLIKD